MKIKILIIYFLLNLSLNIYSEKVKSLLILGDSISAGYGMSKEKQWSEVLKEKLKEEKIDLRIINASISGETTGGGLIRTDKLLKINKPSYLLIELGGNDALRGYPPKKVKNNLLEIVPDIDHNILNEPGLKANYIFNMFEIIQFKKKINL